MKEKDKMQKELLNAWEETYKKGQLTLWIFLALKEGPKYVNELQETIETLFKRDHPGRGAKPLSNPAEILSSENGRFQFGQRT